MKTPEQKIQETLSSLDGMERARAPQGFADQVMTQLNAVRRKRILVSWPNVWLSAAGLLLLLSVNVYVVHEQRAPGRGLVQHGDIRQFSNSYFSPNAGFGLNQLR